MGCAVSDTNGTVEIDIGTLEVLLSPTIGIEIKNKIITSMANNIDKYTKASQQIIKTIANTTTNLPK